LKTAARSDLDALTALNGDYIHSVQHSNVQRFDQILAEDFLCSNPDGSLVERATHPHFVYTPHGEPQALTTPAAWRGGPARVARSRITLAWT
jgi:hypothetical protein